MGGERGRGAKGTRGDEGRDEEQSSESSGIGAMRQYFSCSSCTRIIAKGMGRHHTKGFVVQSDTLQLRRGKVYNFLRIMGSSTGSDRTRSRTIGSGDGYGM